MRRLIAQARERLGVRVWLVAALLTALICGCVAAMAFAIGQMRDAAAAAGHHRQVLTASHDLERLVNEMETSERGYVITGDPVFLRSWKQARARFDPDATRLVSLAQAHNVVQGGRAAQIKQDGESYIRGFSEPLMRTAQRDRNAAVATVAGQAAEQRVDRLAGDFRDFRVHETRLAATTDPLAGADRAVQLAVGGAIGSILLILAVSGYLTREVARPVRQAAVMADELTAGDLDVRVPATGPAEIGRLQRSLDAMATAVRTGREEQTASRVRVLAAADAARCRIERDLHTRIQERLASLTLALRVIERDVGSDHADVAEQLAGAVTDVDDISEELREISRGIHPTVLSLGGLQPALKALTRRCPVPVTLDFAVDGKLTEPLETTVYYLLRGALTNAVDHARASAVRIDVRSDATRLRALVCDDGVGGADLSNGACLTGLRDRVEALGGEFTIDSRLGVGTTLTARIPRTPVSLDTSCA